MKWPVLIALCMGLILISSCALLTVPVVIKFDSSCEWESLVPGEIKLMIEGDDYVIVGTEIDESDLDAFMEDECVLEAVSQEELSTVLQDMQEDLDEERDQKIRQMKLDRTLKKDILDKDDLQDFVERENPEEDWPGGVISPYQLYVTPENRDILDFVEDFDTVEEIYDESLEWVWISDEDLHGETEKWMYPEEFLTETADYDTNPTDLIASDCEEQANTLASLLLASGLYDSDEIRVVLGKVNFDGTIGGHAWVQVYEDGSWLDVEATSGSYYTDDDGFVEVSVDSVSYDYFRYHTYPSVEIWYYYNNDYFMVAETESGNAPSSWSEEGGSYLQRDLESFQRRPPMSALKEGAVVYPLRGEGGQEAKFKVQAERMALRK